MKKNLINMDNIKNYILYIILFLLIFILLGTVSYNNLNKTKKDATLQAGIVSIQLEKKIKEKDKEKYINVIDYNKILDDSIYFDKIARKVIYSTPESGVYKEKVDNNNKIIYEDSNVWISTGNIAKIYNRDIYDIYQTNTIQVENPAYIEGKILNNEVEMYYGIGKNTVYNFHLNKDSIVGVIENCINDNWVCIVYKNGTSSYLGYVLKNNISYKGNNKNSKEKTENKVCILISENGKYSYIDGINTVAFDGLEIINSNGNLREEERIDVIARAKKQNVKIMRTIDNGYMAANADNMVISSMFNSETNRQKSINKILTYCKKEKLYGIVIDFKSLKTTDKNVYTQYLTELHSEMKKSGFVLFVKSNMGNHIDTEKIAHIADGVILELYNERTLASITSGTHCDIKNVTNIIDKYVKKGLENKIILEIPMFNILWTERNGIVMDREIYSAKLSEEYIKTNKIKTFINKGTNQKYFEVKKGSIVYKMWLEDEYALKNKIDLAKKYNLLGISMYKSLYESLAIREVIKNEF